MNPAIASLEGFLSTQKIDFSFPEKHNFYHHLAAACSFQYTLSPNGEGKLTYVNPNYDQIYGVSAEWLLHAPEHLFQAIAPETCQAMQESIVRCCANREAWVAQNAWAAGAGKKWFQGYALPTELSDGSLEWNGFTFPISRNQQVEQIGELLLNYNQQLRQEAAQRTFHLEEELEFYKQQLVSAQKATAEAQAQSFAFQQLALVDGLTQIANRRQFDQSLVQIWQQMRRACQPISLILCDIDYFKRYNDTYGHPMGDFCLKQVAKAMQGLCQDALVARYGGEEFAMILPNTRLDQALPIAEKTRIAVQQLELPHQASQASPYVSLSLGVYALVPQGRISPQDLITGADSALYAAKNAGRNRVFGLGR